MAKKSLETIFEPPNALPSDSADALDTTQVVVRMAWTMSGNQVTIPLGKVDFHDDTEPLTPCGNRCDPYADHCIVKDTTPEIAQIVGGDEEKTRKLSQIGCSALIELIKEMQDSDSASDEVFDSLTGLYKRDILKTLLPGRIARLYDEAGSKRYGDAGVFVAFVDLDGFKAVNDGLGHAQGDEVLRIVGEKLRTHMRSVDSMGRWGGDEIVIAGALIRRDESDDAISCFDPLEFGNRILEALTFEYEGYPISASIGVVSLTEDALCGVPSPDELGVDTIIERADRAMYAAKRNGKGQVAVAL